MLIIYIYIEKETTKNVYVHDDDVEGLTTTTICSITSDTTMDNMILKQSGKFFRDWNMTKLVIFVIDLILIVLVIVFSCEIIFKRYSKRQGLNCFIEDGCLKEQGLFEEHSIFVV